MIIKEISDIQIKHKKSKKGPGEENHQFNAGYK